MHFLENSGCTSFVFNRLQISGWQGALLGKHYLAIWVSSWWLIATLVGAVAIIHFVVIPREERYLEGRFSAEYLDYKASVRRWL
jgi:protein-S-isoprenylcysteine O-methyltransferase Ste14